jgi:hypothetical protein
MNEAGLYEKFMVIWRAPSDFPLLELGGIGLNIAICPSPDTNATDYHMRMLTNGFWQLVVLNSAELT